MRVLFEVEAVWYKLRDLFEVEAVQVRVLRMGQAKGPV